MLIGLIFEDDILNRDFFYLDNNTVKWTIDRINADFEEKRLIPFNIMAVMRNSIDILILLKINIYKSNISKRSCFQYFFLSHFLFFTFH